MKTSLKVLFGALFLIGFSLEAQIPHPRETFGHEVGADYKLADYDQMLAYYDKLAASTDRVQMIEIGKSSMGRPIKLVFISSAENLKTLEKWREISEKLSRAEISEEEARRLSKDGKAIVWIDGGMHATERAHAQMTSELMWKIASEASDEMKKIRDNVITLVVPVINPDGVDIVVDWYRKTLGTAYESTGPPVLYQKYVGHDNNRDWFMNNMVETRVITNVLYNEWYPQIVHNHHQTSPRWAMIFLPPFRSPVNPQIHPGVTTSVNLVGTAMAQRFAMEKKPGVIANVAFSMFWNGGMRTTPYYHNQIGILTEVAQPSPTPTFYDTDSVPENIRGLPTNGSEIFYPYPYEGGEMKFRDAVEYMITASMAILDLAADKKDEFLYNIYSMGRDAITDARGGGAFAYVIPKEQYNASEAINLTNVLMQGGLKAHRATESFTANGKNYKAGSIIFYGAQSFRPYLADLLEVQEYPDQFLYPGGPPQPPYDLAGWTLPIQMGVDVDRIVEDFEVRTDAISNKLKFDAGTVSGNARYGYVLSNKDNQSATAINRLQKAGYTVSQFTEDQEGIEAGSFLIRSKRGLEANVKTISAELGLNFTGATKKPTAQFNELRKVKIGIYKSWQANMDEGWSRWMLEQFEFDLDTLHNKDIQFGDLSKYTAIIMPDQGPASILEGKSSRGRETPKPKKFAGGIGAEGVAALDAYATAGGTIIFYDEASDFAIEQFNLPVKNVTAGIKPNDFFIPGSLVRMNVDNTNRLALGMPSVASASFNRSRAFKINEGAVGITEVSKYAGEDILLSGWALGEETHLANTSAMVHAKRGSGDIVLFAFRPQFRGQSRGTYRMIFNSIYMGAEKNKNPLSNKK